MKELIPEILVKSAILALLLTSLALNYVFIAVIHFDASGHGGTWLHRIQQQGVFESALEIATAVFVPSFVAISLYFWLSSPNAKR